MRKTYLPLLAVLGLLLAGLGVFCRAGAGARPEFAD